MICLYCEKTIENIEDSTEFTIKERRPNKAPGDKKVQVCGPCLDIVSSLSAMAAGNARAIDGGRWNELGL